MSEQKRFCLLSVTVEELQSREPQARQHVQRIFDHNKRIFDQIAALERGDADLPPLPDSCYTGILEPISGSPCSGSDAPNI
jgi:hypothetical protein